MYRSTDILEFWFGPLDGPNVVPDRSAMSMWFNHDNARVNDYMREKYKTLLHIASNDDFYDWRAYPRGCLAHIIVLDNFPRFIYAGEAEAYQYEDRAANLCRWGMIRRADRALFHIERAFFYLPLIHKEDLELHALAHEKLEEVVRECTGRMLQPVGYVRDYYIRSTRTLEAFGRYPERNALLGRTSTEHEEKYLAGELTLGGAEELKREGKLILPESR